MLLTELRQLGTEAMFFFIRHRKRPDGKHRTKPRFRLLALSRQAP